MESPLSTHPLSTHPRRPDSVATTSSSSSSSRGSGYGGGLLSTLHRRVDHGSEILGILESAHARRPKLADFVLPNESEDAPSLSFGRTKSGAAIPQATRHRLLHELLVKVVHSAPGEGMAGGADQVINASAKVVSPQRTVVVVAESGAKKAGGGIKVGALNDRNLVGGGLRQSRAPGAGGQGDFVLPQFGRRKTSKNSRQATPRGNKSPGNKSPRKPVYSVRGGPK